MAKEETLSKEWMDLVEEAMRSNVTKEEFKTFLERRSNSNSRNKEMNWSFLYDDRHLF